MRIYIIANEGITLCSEAPAAMTEGEIAVTSKEELHAAPLSGKRLLALWNALPSVEKRKKVGDRAALIDQFGVPRKAGFQGGTESSNLLCSSGESANSRSRPPRRAAARQRRPGPPLQVSDPYE
jgi:hypothetical protein